MWREWFNLEYYRIIFVNYWWNGIFFILYLAAVIYIAKHGDKLYKQVFVWPFVISMFTVFNPFIIELLLERSTKLQSRYSRFFWMLPVEILCAYLGACLIERQHCKELRLGLILMLACTFFLCGGKATGLSLDDNVYKLDTTVIEVDEMLNQASEEERPIILVDEYIYYWLRQYDASFIEAVGEKEMNKYRWQAADEINAKDQYKNEGRAIAMFAMGVEVDSEIMNTAIENRKIDFFVRNKSFYSAGYLQQLNLTYVDGNEEYELYRCNQN